MKKTKIMVMAAAAALQMTWIQSGSAQQFYPASLEASTASTNPAGNLVYQELKNKDLITTCAIGQGLTNLAGLSLVYDANADALEVVSGTNDTLVCTPLTFATVVPLSNTNGTVLQRFAWVYWEGSEAASGSLTATEQIIPATTNQPAKFCLQGQLQFAVPASGTNPAVIYEGTVSASTPEVTGETNSVSKGSSHGSSHNSGH
jgi:hypothetical protein